MLNLYHHKAFNCVFQLLTFTSGKPPVGGLHVLESAFIDSFASSTKANPQGFPETATSVQSAAAVGLGLRSQGAAVPLWEEASQVPERSQAAQGGLDAQIALQQMPGGLSITLITAMFPNPELKMTSLYLSPSYPGTQNPLRWTLGIISSFQVAVGKQVTLENPPTLHVVQGLELNYARNHIRMLRALEPLTLVWVL